MPTSSTFNTSGTTTSGISITNTSLSGDVNSSKASQKQSFRARVTAINPSNGHIFYEDNYENFTKSDLGTPNYNKTARPLNIYNITVPQIGEIVEIITAPNAESISNNKNTNHKIAYYDRILNTWDNISTNITLDSTVPNQESDDPMSDISETNMKKALILGGI